jgi:ABC-2 type transport system permease protein
MGAYLKVIFNLARMLAKAFFRDKVALFFTFVFPLIFLLIFGLLNRNNSGVSFDTAIINQSDSAFAKQFIEQGKKSGFIKEKPVASLEEAKDKMSHSELDTILLLPPEFGQPNEKDQPSGKAVVFFDPGNKQSGQTFSSIIEGMLGQIDDNITGQKPLFAVEQRSIDEKSLSQFDYIFAGILGFSLLSLGFFGPSNSLPSMKKQGILRRLRTTPLRVSQFIFGNALSYMLIGLISTTFLFIVGLTVFDFKMQGDYLSFGIIAALGTVLMFGFGLSVGGWAKNENQAAPLTNLIAFPMMFLSGIFFPRFLFPEWLQTVSGFLPITPVVDAIRFVIVEGRTIFDLGPQLAMIVAWTGIIYFVAFKVFRWE